MPVFTAKNGKKYRYVDYQKSNLIVCYVPNCQLNNATSDWLSQLEDVGEINIGTRCYAVIYTCQKHLDGFKKAMELFRDYFKETDKVIYVTKEEFLRAI